MAHDDRIRALCTTCESEPKLDEILEDPIMRLLWRGDRLEPASARATVMALRERVRRREGVLELARA